MARNYLNDAQRHFKRIKHYFENAGTGGYSQATHHYSELGECYLKGSRKQPGVAQVLCTLYTEAGDLMAAMKEREQDTPDDGDPIRP